MRLKEVKYVPKNYTDCVVQPGFGLGLLYSMLIFLVAFFR